jgi:hypothetical protein
VGHIGHQLALQLVEAPLFLRGVDEENGAQQDDHERHQGQCDFAAHSRTPPGLKARCLARRDLQAPSVEGRGETMVDRVDASGGQVGTEHQLVALVDDVVKRSRLIGNEHPREDFVDEVLSVVMSDDVRRLAGEC